MEEIGKMITNRNISNSLKKANKISNVFKLIGILLIALSFISSSNAAQLTYVGVQTDPSIVQQPSVTLKVYTSLFTEIPVGGYVEIVVPTEVSLRSGSLTCTMQIPASISVTSCSSSTGRIKVYFGQKVPTDAFELHIRQAVTNPQSTTPTQTFQFTTYSSSGMILDQLVQNIQLTATEGSLSTQTLIPSSSIVGSTAELAVEFTPTHRIPIGSIIQVTFPKWNPQASLAQQVDYFQGAVSCRATKILSGGLSCSFGNSVLTVNNAFQTEQSGNLLGFSVSGFKNPLSTSVVNGFQIVIKDAQGGSIDKGNATLQVNQPASLTNAQVAPDPSVSSAIAGIVQETNKMRIQFNSPVPLNPTCIIKVQMPTQFSVTTVTSVQIYGLFGSTQTIGHTKNLNDNSFTFTSCPTYTSNSPTAYIVIDSLVLPQYSKATNSFIVTIYNSNGDQIATLGSGITFLPKSGSFKSAITLEAVDSTVLATTQLKVTIVPSHNLEIPTRLTMQFPTALQLSQQCWITNVANVNTNAKCSVSGQLVTVDDFLSESFISSSGKSLQFILRDVRMPMTTQQLSGYRFAVLNQDIIDKFNYTVDSFEGQINLAVTFGDVQGQIQPQSNVAYDETVYAFSITPQHYIPQNGYIKIVYPASIQIPKPSFSQSYCANFMNFPSTPACVIDTTSRTILINNGFRLSQTPSSVFNSVAYSFTVPGVQNPLSLQESDSFEIYTLTSDNQVMDQRKTGLTVRMTTTSNMKSVLISPSSYVNSAVVRYTFQLTTTVPVNSNHYVVIQFPPEIKLPTQESALGCYTDDTILISFIQCTFNSMSTNSIKVVLQPKSSQINALQPFKITVNGITNPETTKPTSDFILSITDRQFKAVNTSPKPLTIQTNTPYTLKKASLSTNSTGAGQFAKYTIEITPEHNIQNGGGIQVIYPAQVSVPGSIIVTVNSPWTRSWDASTIDKSARLITIKSAFQMQVLAKDSYPITITLEGFKNPLFNVATNSFIVKTMNIDQSQYYYIDQVTEGLVLNSPCDYPCKTCDSKQKSLCTSCYLNNQYNKLQGGTCVDSCTTGKYYNNATEKCEDCSKSCLACVDSPDKCTMCGTGTAPFLFNNQCGFTCPEGYVTDASKNLCVKCTNNCKTCEFTSSTCTSCTTPGPFPYLYLQQCLATCPTQVSVPSGDKCIPCDATCKTCSLKSTNCTSCLSHMKFDALRNTCTSVCQEGSQIFNAAQGNCLYCDANCKTCAGTTKTCTSCNTGQVLNTDNVCKAKCDLENQIPVEGVCKQCELPCALCKEKTNRCTKCQGDYYLYNATCVQYCPPKYEPNNSTRQCILVGLICPTGFTVNEAGDGCIPNEIECAAGFIINKQRTACVPAPGSLVPFPFLFFTVCLCLLVVGSYIKDKFFTKIYTCLIALISFQEILIYILMVAYAGAMSKWAPFALSLVATLMLMTANIFFYLIYKREIVKDQTFAKWCRLYPKTQKYLPIIALFINFKTIKLIYSGFYGQESCLAQFDDPMRNFFRPLRMVTYFNIIFIYMPIIVADILIFISTPWGYQLLVLAIESLILAILILILTFLEFRKADTLIHSGDEQYIRIKPKGLDNQTLVMSGIVDYDESTLVRSKVVDDDYEVHLRKKALVSILSQVGKNYMTAQQAGINLGGDLDKCMSKFDEDRIKLRRAFSLESIQEEDSWVAETPRDGRKSLFQPTPFQEDSDDDGPRRYSYPLTPRTRATVADPTFNAQIKLIKQANEEYLQDNVYADCKPPDKNKEQKRKKTVSRRTQTYLRELLQLDGENLQDSDLEVIMEDEAEIDNEFAQNLIDGVLDGLSESESNMGNKRRKARPKKTLNAKRKQEVPEFELADIMGDFEIDDLGNFIILRGEKGELLDKKERRVNRRGYLIDRFGNIINKNGQIIFKAIELDSDDEIPAPFGFEKRKKNLLNLGKDGEFKVENKEKKVDDDEDDVDKELKKMKKGSKKKGQPLADGQIAEEQDDESSLDSLMAESPGKYQDGQENDIIDRVTKKKVPRKKPTNTKQSLKKTPGLKNDFEDTGFDEPTQKKPYQNQPPKRIKREDTKELFPSLAIESIEQKKLFKIAESIGGMATQLAESVKKNQPAYDNADLSNQQSVNQERLERLKQEHFKDILETNKKAPKQGNQSTNKLPSRANLDKIYGNLNDVVSYEERQILEQMKRAQTPMDASQLSSRMGNRGGEGVGLNRRLKGLESIYLQKFDKKSAQGNRARPPKANKFRNTLNQFVDDPELLLDDGMDVNKQNEMSLMIAEKLDKLQKQYMSNTATNRFSELPIRSMGYNKVELSNNDGKYFGKKNASVSGSLEPMQQDSLDPIKKGNWVKRE